MLSCRPSITHRSNPDVHWPWDRVHTGPGACRSRGFLSGPMTVALIALSIFNCLQHFFRSVDVLLQNSDIMKRLFCSHHFSYGVGAGFPGRSSRGRFPVFY